MSNQTFLAFIAAAGEHEDIARGLADATNGLEGEAAVRAVSGYATARGFPLSPAEVEAGRAAIVDALDSQSELSDADLENVAGGIVDPGTISLTTVAVGSAIGIGGILATYGAFAAGATALTVATVGVQKSLDIAKSFFKGW